MRRRSRRNFWIALVLSWGVLPALAVGCGDQDPDDGPDGGAGSGGGSSGGSGGSSGGLGGERNDGDGGTGDGARDGGAGSGGHDGIGGALVVPDCLDALIDDSCEVGVRVAVDGWNCALRFPRDSLGAEDGTALRVFIGCDEFLGLGGGAGSGGRDLWTFDHRTDTVMLGRDACESAADGVVVTAIAGCN